jgi:hypothetical protein
MEVSQKLKIDLPYNPIILLLVIYSKECKSIDKRDSCIPMFIAALFTTSKLCNQLRHPERNEWMKKMWYVYTIKQNEIMSFTGK